MDAAAALLGSASLSVADPGLGHVFQLPVRPTETVDQVADDVLRSFVFPDPDSIVLPRMDLSRIPPTRVFARAMAQAGVPVQPGNEAANEPYFLMHGWDNELSAKERSVLEGLSAKFGKENSVILFAASGMGKSRLLLRFLRDNAGMLFVRRLADSKNSGSLDVEFFTREMHRVVEYYKDRISPTTLRGFVAEELRCLLVARIVLKRRWEAKAGKALTPKQWTLAQLHSDVFLPHSAGDVFYVLSRELYLRAKRSSVQSVSPDRPATYWALDEAQNVAVALKGAFPSRNSEDRVKRSLLACFADAVSLVGGKKILAGTSLSMMEAVESVDSSSVILPDLAERALFRKLPTFTTDDVDTLVRAVGVGEPPLVVRSLLQGRPRYTTSFLEKLAAAECVGTGLTASTSTATATLLSVFGDFYEEMTKPVGKSRATVGGVVRGILNDSRLHGSVKVPGKAGDGDDNDARTTRSVDDAHYALKTRTWRVMNGERAVLTEDEATVLVEAGVLSEVQPASGERGIGAADEEEHLDVSGNGEAWTC